MARVNEGSHSFTCHPHVYPQMEWVMPAFTPQPQSIIALWLVRISRPLRVGGWVGLGVAWWNTEMVCPPKTFTHPSTNRARRRATSLIRPTTLPLRHAATNSVRYTLSMLPHYLGKLEVHIYLLFLKKCSFLNWLSTFLLSIYFNVFDV